MKAIVDSKEFKRIMQALKPFTCIYNDKMKFIRMMVNSENQEILFEALDGHRIAMEYLKCTTDESFTAYIKPFVFGRTKDEKISIELLGNKVLVTKGEYIIGFKQPEGEWYDTSKILDDTYSKEITSVIGVNPKLLQDALKYMKADYKDLAQIEIRGIKDPIIVKDPKDKRNVRIVLPVTLSNYDIR
jgi:DNA polymerase III sliding clamp (beta) subunit (PCNA family)